VANPPRRPSLDSVTTIQDDGSRPFIYTSDTHGRFSQARRGSAFALFAFYLSLPWIKLNGYPAVFLDVAERRFHLFGITGAAQDLWLMFFIITGLGFSLFFVTALLGRVWCGWACPHTVFLDHVYRRIERLIEGDAVRRRALAAAPLSVGKILKVGLKHTLYVLVSAVITHLLLAYFVSVPEVWVMMRAAPTEHWSAFGVIAVATGALYFNFAWFREQLCIVVCPYGRIQSALIDDNSLVVGYDAKRGEPRGKVGTPAAGDCVACSRCVQVCPTGIDIKQGLQMECVSCTQCIDPGVNSAYVVGTLTNQPNCSCALGSYWDVPTLSCLAVQSCVARSTWSASGSSPCASCTQCAAGSAPTAACTTTNNTVCAPCAPQTFATAGQAQCTPCGA
jgi:hypothetical protein